MIKHISFFTFFLFSCIAFAQCDVNENQAPFLADPEGSYSIQLIDGMVSSEPLTEGYDTLTAFPNAIEGSLYEAVVGVRIPNDTSFVYDLGSGPQLFENVQTNQSGFSKNARDNAADSRKAVGTLEGDISKNVAPNIGYMLGKTGSPTQSRDAEIEQYKKTISDFQKRNNLLVGGANSYRGPGNP